MSLEQCLASYKDEVTVSFYCQPSNVGMLLGLCSQWLGQWGRAGGTPRLSVSSAPQAGVLAQSLSGIIPHS